MKSFFQIVTVSLAAAMIPDGASASAIRCFGLEGEMSPVQPKKTVELTAKARPEMGGSVEYTGEGNSYHFHAMVFGDSAVLSISTKQLPIGQAASSPAIKLESLSKSSTATGRLKPTSLLSLINPDDKNAPLAQVGCGIDE